MMSSFKGGHAKEARAARLRGGAVNWLVNGGVTSGSASSTMRATVGAVCATTAAPISHRNNNQRQVHHKHNQKLAASYRAPAAGEHCIEQLNAGGLWELCGPSNKQQQRQQKHFGKRARGAGAAHNVRLLSIISLIVISMLSRECTARAFLGIAGGPSQQQLQLQQQQPLDSVAAFNAMDNYSNNNADKQQVLSSSSAQTAPGLGLDYALELGCRNLVESILAQPRDQQQQRTGAFAASDFLEFMDNNERIKRLSPKHTPRFGRR